ncbi:MAG: RdgB/HAM1 family non-canonical purine NTP pyrophosphatase [Euryarchaeota archaeon]|nr:RdgB/HAM1 family non-canonical purine NTP pyrophosphatase [Euryarchaeota archaeon]
MEVEFITGNEHKFRELAAALKEAAGDAVRLRWRRQRYTEVQAGSLEEVVLHALEEVEGEAVLVEDAGLFVSALNGFPGVYSAYVHETIGSEGILRMLRGERDRRACMVSVLGLRLGEEVRLFRGEVQGRIAHRMRGEHGFGYDPVFIPAGCDATFAEAPELKAKLSHRKRAAEKLAEYLLSLQR